MYHFQFAPQFDNARQHDAHELASFLIDGIHEDLNRIHLKAATATSNIVNVVGVGSSNSGATNSTGAMDGKTLLLKIWQQHLIRNDSIISSTTFKACTGHHSHVHTATINPQNSTFTPLYP